MQEARTVPKLKKLPWFNSQPLDWPDLVGHVIMFDFMTYSCVNCIRTFDHMRQMWHKYRDKGFLLIGIQTPEFEFEKDPRNVEAAIKRYQLDYPIVMDNDFELWNFFLNQYWPSQYFVDAKGNFRHVHIGEGGEEEIEEWIVRLLREAGHDLPMEKAKEKERPREEQTPEIYAGSARNAGLGNGPVCLPNGCHQYIDKIYRHEPEALYLNGNWEQLPEYLEHEDDEEAYVLLIYNGREVNVVLTSPQKVEVEVLLDGKSIGEVEAGQDIVFRNGRRIVDVNRDDMFRLVKMKATGQHQIKLVTRTKGLRVFAFTFG